MNSIEFAKEIANEVNKKVRRVYWTNEEIDKYFARRSAKQIIDSGTTCFMNPCFDLTLVSAYFISSQHIPHKFVIEEHLPTKEFDFNRLHFAIEFEHENKDYVINFKRGNEVYIFEGKYNGRKDIPRASMIKIPGTNINPYKTLNDNLGYNNLEALTKDKFVNYSLEKNLKRLKQDNSKIKYDLYRQKYGKEFNIITGPQNQP